MAFFTAEEPAWWATIQLTVGRAVEVHFLAVIVVDVASGSGRWCLCSGGSCCRGRVGGWGG